MTYGELDWQLAALAAGGPFAFTGDLGAGSARAGGWTRAAGGHTFHAWMGGLFFTSFI
jgi:hypothetical protein